MTSYWDISIPYDDRMVFEYSVFTQFFLDKGTIMGNHGDVQWEIYRNLPSGQRLHSYGKSSFLMGKSTIPMGHFQ